MSAPNSAEPHVSSREAAPKQWLILKAGLLYFGIVFTVGFILGPIRIFWAVPRFGPRVAELMEMPFMLIAIVLAALWVVRRLSVPPGGWTRLCIGCVALGFLLLAEFGAVLQLRGLTVSEYLADRDPVSGTVYLWMLGLFAVMPWLITRQRARSEPST